MRFLLLLLTLLLSAGQLAAQGHRQPPELHQKVHTQLLQEQRQQLANKKRQEQLALEQLSQYQNPGSWKHISWQEFLRQNKHTQDVERVSTHLDINCTEEICRLLPGPIPLEMIQKESNGDPDYKTLLAGQKLIFVAEGINHNTKRAPQEMAKILQAVRAANPNAKILFAAEFLEWESHENLASFDPEEEKEMTRNIENIQDLIKQYQTDSRTLSAQESAQLQRLQRQYESERELWQGYQIYKEELKESIRKHPLLKKAGQPTNLTVTEEYIPAFQAADELGIDQLALDDTVWGAVDNKIGAKVGEFVVWSTPHDKLPAWGNLKQPNISKETKRFFALHQLASASPWGVRERNREWARRIKTLMPLYDIVIVYAGDGHLNTTYHLDLQPMLEQKDFINITLYPLETLPQEHALNYQQRSDILESRKITQNKTLQETQNQAFGNIDLEQLIDDSNYIEIPWTNKQKPLWYLSYSSVHDDTQIMARWDPEKTKLYEQECAQQEKFFPYKTPAFHLFVYLPAD